eukprot:CAMPEP_0201696774 /NCGR_PEP_ID=MMETSP0578-20130828/8322_1 /ASSEMBLY_ACC=CAM_ASM_000663 /TAXON_ID=267565 /ORGANISM="Skeletonema grethea, Strain CCMP 1804" /LENGTH=381 /DNA_ID=CAMNT_0048182803 /DNA_START=140 /DNA_END=1285 /DNA_ORIENTATION=+
MPPFTRSSSTLQSSVEKEESGVNNDWSSMTVVQLKAQLKERGLPVSGVKPVLIERLEGKDEAVAVASATSATTTTSKYFAKQPSSPVTVTAKTKGKVSAKTPTKRGSPSKSKSPGKSPGRSPKRVTIEPGSLKPPTNWEKIYSLVEELRADRSAPVDTDGGEALPEKHLGEVVYRFQVLTALMLSSQTKDAVVGETMRILQQHGLTVENIHQTDHETLNGLIKKVGFHNNKTKFMKQSAEIILTQYNGDIPPTADEMMKLPGVGPKMAYIVESIAFDTASGIGVDTHMHRMFNDLKWVTSKTPEETREQLEGWLPRDKWGSINYIWVGFGQEVQQQKEKMLRKCLASSSPREALGLVKKLRMDVKKEAKRFGLEDDIKRVM